MFNFHKDVERAFPSSHRRIRGAAELLDAALDEKERAVVHYTNLAQEAREDAEMALDGYCEADVESILASESAAAVRGYTRVFDSGMGHTDIHR